MATREIEIYDESYEAANLTIASQYNIAAYVGSSGQVQHAGGTNGMGIIQNKPEGQGRAVTVRHLGISRCNVNGSGTPINIGNPIMGSAGGVGVVATAGNIAIGFALQASTVNGDVIAVLLTGPFRIHA